MVGVPCGHTVFAADASSENQEAPLSANRVNRRGLHLKTHSRPSSNRFSTAAMSRRETAMNPATQAEQAQRAATMPRRRQRGRG